MDAFHASVRVKFSIPAAIVSVLALAVATFWDKLSQAPQCAQRGLFFGPRSGS